MRREAANVKRISPVSVQHQRQAELMCSVNSTEEKAGPG